MPTVHTRTCHICEANCGVLIEVECEDILSIKGDPDHVLSRGHICPKATALQDLQYDPDRLRLPQKKAASGWESIGWDQAFREIGARFAALGGAQPALYIGNPTAHNYSVGTQTRALRKALGVKGIYSASTLDQIPHQLVQMWMYGHNALFPIPDIDRTQSMLIVGGNPLASNGSVWTVPDVRNRIKELQARGGRLTVVDPRRTETAKIADAHHFIRPGTDPAFFLGLLLALDEAGLVDPGRVADMLDEDWPAIWDEIRRFDLADLAAHCGIPEADIRSLAAELGDEDPAIVYGRIGVSTQRWGTLNLWLIQLLNIAIGAMDREGGVMFSNPAIDLAGSAGPGTYDRFRSRIGDHPECIGEFPSATIAEEIITPGEGQVRALVTVAGNPVLSAPGGTQLDDALETLDLMVSIDMYVTETSRHADYILPPCGPLQKDHYPLALGPLAVRNYACYSPPIFEKAEDELSDWEIVAGLAAAIETAKGGSAANPRHPRDFLDMALQRGPHELTLAEVEAHPHGIDLGPHQPRLPDRLATSDKLIHTAPPLCREELTAFRTELAEAREPDALALIGRRHVRSNNSWLHNSKRLVKGPDRCTAMIHPDDAKARNIADGDDVEVTSRVGTITLAAEITDDIMPGTISIPHGWGHDRKGVDLSVATAHAGVSINDLTDPRRMDPVTGNAAFNGTPVTVRRSALAIAAE
ncbi:MAG: molybdopterin oxidoreductase family protein [Pacificimonas sp.]